MTEILSTELKRSNQPNYRVFPHACTFVKLFSNAFDFKGLNFSVLGAVIGKQKGRNIEVMNSFELVFDTIEGDIVINMEYYNTKEGQCKE